MKKLTLRSVKGWLSHDDIEKLEEAAKRPLKYAKTRQKSTAVAMGMRPIKTNACHASTDNVQAAKI